jgi:hypothetical protein
MVVRATLARARTRAGIAPVLVGAVVLSFLSPACAVDDRALTVREPAIVPNATGFVAGTNDVGIREGVNAFRLVDVAPTTGRGGRLLDPHALVLFQLHVTTSPTQATPFDFCIWNLTALTD